MPGPRRYARWAFSGVGFLLMTVVPMSLSGRASASDELLVGVVATGTVLLFAAMVLQERSRRTGDGSDRVAGVQFRAGWYAFWFVMPPAWATMMATTYTDLTPPVWVVVLVALGGFLVYQGSKWWLERRPPSSGVPADAPAEGTGP